MLLKNRRGKKKSMRETYVEMVRTVGVKKFKVRNESWPVSRKANVAIEPESAPNEN